MKLINEDVAKELQTAFKDLDKSVKIKYFTQEMECHFCKETHSLLGELQEVHDKLELEVFDFSKDKAEAEKLGIDKIPATTIMTDEDVGIRFYGIPSGYEFSSLIQAILTVSTGKSMLKPETVTALKAITQDVHIQVFVTPTCAYCPPAVMLAHQMAYLNPHIKADMVEATEFPHLAQKYQVMGVPRTVINESHHQEGAAPEELILDKIKEALKTS
jgi:glutaredoxin-like protein